MPTYHYQCPACKDELVAHHGMNETPEYICLCSRPRVRYVRIIKQAPGFQLKGKGWFKDGY